MLLIIYLSAIETLVSHREMSLKGSTSFGFTQNMILDFQNTVLNSLWHCLMTNATKIEDFFSLGKEFSLDNSTIL